MLVAAVPGLVAAFFAYRAAHRASRQTAEQERRTVDADAYIRAKGLYEASIEELTERIDRLTTEQDRLRAEAVILRREVEAYRLRVRELERDKYNGRD